MIMQIIWLAIAQQNEIPSISWWNHEMIKVDRVDWNALGIWYEFFSPKRECYVVF